VRLLAYAGPKVAGASRTNVLARKRTGGHPGMAVLNQYRNARPEGI